MEKWYPVWGHHIQDYSPIPASLNGLTQEIKLQSSISGKKLRLLLSNKYGTEELLISEITVGTGDDTCSLTVDGKERVRLEPDGERYTDAAEFPVRCGSEITVCMKLSGGALCAGCVGFNSDRIAKVSYFDEEGAGVAAGVVSAAVEKGFSTSVCVGIRSIETDGITAAEKTPARDGVGKPAGTEETPPVVIAVFGDSIVRQGHWYGSLHKKLIEAECGWTLYNEGVSGNRVIYDNHSVSALNPIFGKAGIKRFQSDVYSIYRPDIVLIAEGINELVHPGNGCPMSELPTANELISGLNKLQSISRINGSIPVVATLSPFCDYDGIWNRDREQIRGIVNHWVRQQENYVDIDVCVGSREKEFCLEKEYDGGDHLHLNETAGETAAEEVFRVLKNIITVKIGRKTT